MSALGSLEDRVLGSPTLSVDLRVPVTGARGFVEAPGLLRLKDRLRIYWRLGAPPPLAQSFISDGARWARRMIGASGDGPAPPDLCRRIALGFVRLGSWGVAAAARREGPLPEVEDYLEVARERTLCLTYRVHQGPFAWRVELVMDSATLRPLQRTLKELRSGMGGAGWIEYCDVFSTDASLEDGLFRPETA